MSSSVFDNLVQGMSRDERHELLQKIQSDSIIDSEPIAEFLEDPSQIDLAEEYHKLSLLQKIIVWFKRVFTGRDVQTVTEQMLISRLGNRVDKDFPGIIDLRHSVIKEDLAYRVDDLRNQLSWLAGPLGNVLGDSRRQFLAFMFGVANPGVYDLIREKTDPETAVGQHPEFNDRELKKYLLKNLQEILESVGTDQRQILYMNYRFLYHLLQLASFPYTKILQEFKGADERYIPVAFGKVEGALRRLDSQINSTTETPSVDILQQVFVFLEQGKEDEEYQAEQLGKQIKRAADAVGILRNFVRQIPLRDIIAFFSGDIRYMPMALAGGEDWFALFREHLNKIVEQRFDAWVYSRRRKEIISAMIKTADVSSFPLAEPYATSPAYSIARHHFSVSVADFVLNRFFSGRWLSPLKILMIDGEFYKDHNREEYNEAYQKLERSEESLAQFLQTMPDQPRHAPTDNRMVIDDMDARARRIVDDVLGSLRMLANIIDGILFGEVGGRFDTIANLGQINGRANKVYLQQLERVLKEIGQARDWLAEALDLEGVKTRA